MTCACMHACACAHAYMHSLNGRVRMHMRACMHALPIGQDTFIPQPTESKTKTGH